MTKPSCWIVTEGAAGMESQCRGLSEALGLEAVIKRVNPRLPWLALPSSWWPCPFRSLGSGSDRFDPPWPDILISCGRKSVAIALAVKRASGGRSFLVHVQDPLMNTAAFDLVAAPGHDRVKGANVIVTRGALHPVTPEKLGEAARHFRPLLAALPRPLVAVLVGGANGRDRFTPADAARIADQLVELARSTGAGLAVTPSRRTGAEYERILRERLKEVAAYLWDGSGENPYLGLLALSDYILVTSDSVSMASEACATGKPVYILELAGGSKRHRKFHDELREAGLTRPFEGRLERWSYAPLLDAEVVAAEVRRRLARRARAKIEAEPA
ncbi:MAG: mitochondrial fission ELM1 family protein [Alphaproteobacteria bacterium]